MKRKVQPQGSATLKILTVLTQSIYQGLNQSLLDKIASISQQQSCLYPNDLGFWYKNTPYGTVADRKFNQNSHPLDITLHVPMDAYLHQLNEFKVEANYVKSFIQASISLASDLGQLFQVLPTPQHEVLFKLGFSPVPQYEQYVENVLKFNQKGYDLLLQRNLKNTIGYL